MSDDVYEMSVVQDKHFYLNGISGTMYDILAGVDEVLEAIKHDGNFNAAGNVLRSMTTLGHAIGISKAKLLHGMKQLWSGGDATFYQFVITNGRLNSMVVIDRYIQAWDAVTQFPPELADKLLSRPMKDLNALGAAINQGYEIELETWDDLANSGSNSEFLDVIRTQVKGKSEKKENGLTIMLEENGDLSVWKGKRRYAVGYLYLDEEDEPIQKAIERIVKCAGINRRKA